MDSSTATDTIRNSKHIVLIERHLQAELQLLQKLDVMNQTLKAYLESSGSNGLALEQTEHLTTLADELSLLSVQQKQRRSKVLDQINAGRDAKLERLSIKQFIATLGRDDFNRLEILRLNLLDQLTEVHAMLAGNQAVMYYSFDFYQRMVSGFLNQSPQENQYSQKGQKSLVKPGNLYGKAC